MGHSTARAPGVAQVSEGGAASDLVADLLRSDAYPGFDGEVGFVRTHISWLFFAGDLVYKVKQPVDLGFLDMRTLAQRRHLCEEEVRLNQRLAPGVYRGIVPVTVVGGRHVIGGGGPPVDWAVEMLRLPAQRMLAVLLAQGELDNQLVHDVVRLLVAFHAEADAGPEVAAFGEPDAVAALMAENLAQAAAVAHGTLSPLQHAFLSDRNTTFVEGERSLLARRVAEGRIREGHGDLHAENLCFRDGGVVAYDRLEFSKRFRCGDVALDLAFLAMDLDQRGYPAFSRYLVRRYADAAEDDELQLLIGPYKAYRATVRGKVAALGEGPDARRAARRYFQLACGYWLPPTLVLMCGLPASGKSSLASALAHPLRAVVLRSDVRRKVRAGAALEASVRPGVDQGLYAPARRAETYRVLLLDAVRHLRRGRSVVLDATCSTRATRALFVDAAARLGLPWVVAHVTAGEARTRRRLARRRSGPSDADLAVYLAAARTFETPDEVERAHLLRVVSGFGRPEVHASRMVDLLISQAGSS